MTGQGYAPTSPAPGSRAPDVLALIILTAIPVSLFWPHLLRRATFIGDSDRLNHYLTWLKQLCEGLRAGYIPTWNEAMFGGYSVVALPYAFPAPLPALAALWPPRQLVYAAGVLSCASLALAGWAAYAFLRDVTRSPFAAFAGAGIYQTSAGPVLGIAQNDMSFTVVIVAPLAFLAVRRIRAGHSAGSFLALSLLLGYLLTVGFLMTAGYASLFLGAYALYRTACGYRRAVVVLAAAALVAAVVSFPRIYTVAEELSLSTRHYAGGTSRDFATVYREANTIYATQLLRWFDDRIFGPHAAEVYARNPGINIHEGVQIYGSAFAAFLAIGAALLALGRLVGWGGPGADGDVPFFVGVVAFAFFVAVSRNGYWLMYHLFGHIDFMHARIVTVATLPHCLLAAVALARLRGDTRGYTGSGRRATVVIGSLVLAVLAVWAIESVAASRSGYDMLPVPAPFGPWVHLLRSAVWRVLASLALFAVVLGFAIAYRRHPGVRLALGGFLGFVMLGQAYVYAHEQTIGPHVRATPPTLPVHNRLLARREEFTPPSPAALRAFHAVLEPERYRTAIVCDRAQTIILCAPHIANFWRLRTVEGYVSAVPTRVAVLPWSEAISLRSVNFVDFESLPWPLLGLLNVKSAIGLDRALMTNAVRLDHRRTREAIPDDVPRRDNPAPVTPRVYFARSVRAVPDLTRAREALFPGGVVDAAGYDVVSLSYVEGFPADREFAAMGDVAARFRDQRVDIEVTPAPTERFLVLNERFHPRWHAYAGGREVRIYATNVFMRGVVVPPDVRRLSLRYVPLVVTPAAWACYAGAGVLLIAGVWFWARIDRRRASPV